MKVIDKEARKMLLLAAKAAIRVLSRANKAHKRLHFEALKIFIKTSAFEWQCPYCDIRFERKQKQPYIFPEDSDFKNEKKTLGVENNATSVKDRSEKYSRKPKRHNNRRRNNRHK